VLTSNWEAIAALRPPSCASDGGGATDGVDVPAIIRALREAWRQAGCGVARTNC
jgi:hypothetical protein